MNFLELILQLSLLFPIFYFTQHYQSIMFLSITIDSAFSAINFVKVFMMHDYSQKELLKKLNHLYIVDIINRYIYYVSLEVLYLVMCNFFWYYTIAPLYYILLLTICPAILNHICNVYLIKIVNFIDSEKRKFIKVVICKQLSSAINTISDICIDTNPEINYTELLFLFDDYDKTTGNFTNFLKNFLIISLIHYTRKNSNKVYGKLLTYFYNYKTGELIESVDLTTAKKRFSEVIVKRKWNRLLNTDILQSIIYIYSLQDDNRVDYIGVYVTKFNYTLIKMFTIWTTGAFFRKSYLLSLLSIFFMLYRKPVKIYFEREQLYKYLFRIIALATGFFIDNYLLLSFICEFGYALIFNRVMNTVVQYVWNKSEKILKIVIHYNKYNIFLISIFIYLKAIKTLSNYAIISYEHHITNYVFFMINTSSNYKKIIMTLAFSLGVLSNYSDMHILYILGLSYLFLNIEHHYANNNNPTIRIPISTDVINTYYGVRDDVDDTIVIDDKDLIDSSIKPAKPLIYEDDIQRGENVVIFQDNIGIIDNYQLSKSKIIDKRFEQD